MPIPNPTFRAIAKNVIWLIIDKVLRLGANLILLAWMARYLGPGDFGIYSYILAFTAIFCSIGTLGLDGIAVRELVGRPTESKQILGSTFALRICGSLVSCIVSVVVILYLHSSETELLWMIGISTFSSVFLAFDVIDYWFQSQTQSRYAVIARNLSAVIIIALKSALILLGAPLELFVISLLADGLLTSATLLVIYSWTAQSTRNWQVSSSEIKRLMRDSWPLLLSSVSIAVYMKIDQVAIGQILGEQQVGIYAAAVRLVEIWYVLPMVIATSAFPTLYRLTTDNLEAYYKNLQTLLDLLVACAVVIAVATSLAAKFLVVAFYGEQYASAALILQIYSWNLVFVFLLVATGQHLIAKNKTKFAFYRNFFGMITNIAFNLFLIPQFGITGAALSSLASHAISAYLFNLFSKDMRKIFIMETSSFVFPVAIWRIYHHAKNLR